MKELIDKAAVVAELERLISNGQTKLKESEERKDYESYVALAERIATCINVLSILDTLEVKEVDLEKEYDNEFFKDAVFGKLVNRNAGISIAKHFFELGLKTKVTEEIEKKNLDTLEEKTWKPNEEQMKAFSAMIRFVEIATSFDARKQRLVESLYRELSKLVLK